MKSAWIWLFLMCLCGYPATEESCDRSAGTCTFADMAMTSFDDGGSFDLPVSADASVPGQTGVCSVDGWCWRNPLPQGNRLTGVSGTAPNNVWAVGLSETIPKLN